MAKMNSELLEEIYQAVVEDILGGEVGPNPSRIFVVSWTDKIKVTNKSEVATLKKFGVDVEAGEMRGEWEAFVTHSQYFSELETGRALAVFKGALKGDDVYDASLCLIVDDSG